MQASRARAMRGFSSLSLRGTFHFLSLVSLATLAACSPEQSGPAGLEDVPASDPVPSGTPSPRSATVIAGASVVLATDASGEFEVRRLDADGRTLVPAGSDASLRLAPDTGLVLTPAAAGTYVVRAQGATAGGTVVFALPAPAGRANLSLSTLRISPRTADLAPGASLQFMATHSWEAGSTQGPPTLQWAVASGGDVSPEWVAVGGSWTLSGKFTAGASAGTYRVIAYYENIADTAYVTVGGGAPPTTGQGGDSELASLALEPATVSLPANGTVQLVANYAWSGGTRTGAPSLSWSASGGRVSGGWVERGGAWVPAGFYQAPAQSGTYHVVSWYGGRADTTVVTVTGDAATPSGPAPSPTAPTPPPSGGAVTNPSLLPVAAGQVPNVGAYGALGVPSRPSGWSYTDPTTGVRVWKVTTASVPAANLAGGHDYSEGGQEVSLPWGPSRDRYTIHVKLEGGGHWLVDFQLGVGLSNWRQPVRGPNSDLAWSFSNNPATPQIAYVVSGSTLYRINTATNTQLDGNGFPHSDTFVGGSPWLSMDKNDAWFTWMSSASSAVAWNAQTGVRRTFSDPALNEIRLHPDGDWANLALNGYPRFWNLATGTVSAPASMRIVHNASLRGGLALQMDVDGAVPPDVMRVQAGASPTVTSIADGFAGYNYHGSGNWIQSDTELGGNLLRQWALFASYNSGPSAGGFPVEDARHLLQNALGFIRADGSEMRLLAHTYSPYNGQYWQIPRAKASPDGRLVLFDSNMQLSGRADLFLAEVPAQ